MIAEDRIPVEWKSSILVPLFKGKGDSLEFGSFRAIKILEQTLKIVKRVLEMRIRSQVQDDEMQFRLCQEKEPCMSSSLRNK